MFTVGKNDCGKWNWKYATAISPASTNATGRVNTPRVMARPPTNSRMAPIHICDITGIGGIGMGLGGKPNRIVVPADRNISPATMRRTLSMRLVQGDGEGSKIDMRHLVLGVARDYRKFGRLIKADEFGEFYALVK